MFAKNCGMNSLIKKYWEDKPLQLILLTAFVLRVIAAVFSKGFGMHDDHFLVIEPAQAFLDGGADYNWLPGQNGTTQPSGHSWFYVGLHYLLFGFLGWIKVGNPEVKMYIVRLIHAIYSLSIVYLGYKIAERFSTREIAKKTGLLLALFWFMPCLSVRNLVEVVCVSPILYSAWRLMKYEKQTPSLFYHFITGLILGIAFSIRYQCALYIGGIGLVLLFQKRWRTALLVGSGAVISVILVQGVIDYFIWGYPFAEFREYVQYNIDNAYNYETNKWYSYLLLVVAILIPPVSICLILGFFRKWKQLMMLVFPTILFFAFHSYFPNKQERFILPAVPFIIIAGMIGWEEWIQTSDFWKRKRGLIRGFWIFFAVINFLLLPIITTLYSKRARVESMNYIRQKGEKFTYLLLEDTNRDDCKMPPRFYLGFWPSLYNVSQTYPVSEFKKRMDQSPLTDKPRYALFFEDKRLKSRVDSIKNIFPEMTYETTITPSFVDDILYKINPKNTNQVIYIYKLNPR